MAEAAADAQSPAGSVRATGSASGYDGARPSPKKSASRSAEKDDAPGEAYASADKDEERRALQDELGKGGISAPRRISALAAVAVDSGATRYQIPVRLTIPDASATMVLLINQRVPGEAVFLFAPDGGVPDSTSHPFRVARFTNATTGLLERGPIAVFEKGAFLGQGMLDPLPPKATATVPFALERSLAVESERRNLELGSRIFKIEAGELSVERDSVTRTVYRIKNGAETNAKLLVRHPRLAAARLYKPPAGTEDNLGAGNALIPIQIQAAGKAELTVEERQPSEQRTDWLSALADDAVKGYLADPRADPTIAAALTTAWAQRNALKQVVDTQSELTRTQGELEKSARETRLSAHLQTRIPPRDEATWFGSPA